MGRIFDKVYFNRSLTVVTSISSSHSYRYYSGKRPKHPSYSQGVCLTGVSLRSFFWRSYSAAGCESFSPHEPWSAYLPVARDFYLGLISNLHLFVQLLSKFMQ
jgi:hypothetical protein